MASHSSLDDLFIDLEEPSHSPLATETGTRLLERSLPPGGSLPSHAKSKARCRPKAKVSSKGKAKSKARVKAKVIAVKTKDPEIDVANPDQESKFLLAKEQTKDDMLVKPGLQTTFLDDTSTTSAS